LCGAGGCSRRGAVLLRGPSQSVDAKRSAACGLWVFGRWGGNFGVVVDIVGIAGGLNGLVGVVRI